MVSVAREKVLFRFWLVNLLYYVFWISEWSQIYPNFIRRVIKPEMKIKLRVEGAVNGHKFVITGEGWGQPFE